METKWKGNQVLKNIYYGEFIIKNKQENIDDYLHVVFIHTMNDTCNLIERRHFQRSTNFESNYDFKKLLQFKI